MCFVKYRNLKMVQNEHEDMDMILNCFGPLFKLEKCFGIFRYCVKNGKVVAINKLLKICPVVIVCTYLSLYLYFNGKYVITNINHADLGNITLIGDGFFITVPVVQYVTSVIIFLKQSENNVRLFKTIAKVDHILNVSNDKYFFKSIHNRIRFEICIFMIIFTLTCISYGIREKEFHAYQIFVVAIDLQRHIEAFAVYIFLKILSYRLDVLNKHLQNFIIRRNKEPFSVNHKKKKNFFELNINYIGNISAENNKLQQLSAAYQRIGEATCFINEIFNAQILMSLTASFIYTIFMIWSSIYDFRRSQLGYGFFAIAIQTGFEILIIGVISYVCEILILKRNNTKVLVNEIVMDYDVPKSMRLQAKNFLELIEVWPLQVTTYDLYVIDIKLMLQFMSMSTTYIIVLTQLFHLF